MHAVHVDSISNEVAHGHIVLDLIHHPVGSLVSRGQHLRIGLRASIEHYKVTLLVLVLLGKVLAIDTFGIKAALKISASLANLGDIVNKALKQLLLRAKSLSVFKQVSVDHILCTKRKFEGRVSGLESSSGCSACTAH